MFVLPEKSNDPIPKGYIDLSKTIMDMPSENPLSTSKVKTMDPIAYVFTSGTTGLSKASILIHYRLIAVSYFQGRTVLEVTPNDTLYVCLPFFHTNATSSGWAPVFGGGEAVAISRKFSVSSFWNDIRKFNATMFVYVGEVCRYLLNQPQNSNDRNHSVRAILGNGIRPDFWHEFKSRFGIDKIFEFYGASETSGLFMNMFNFEKTVGFYGEGYAIVKYDVKKNEPVKKEIGFLKKVKVGETGLLLFEMKAERTFVGYTIKEATSRKVLRKVLKEGDAYFNTGDLVQNQGNKHIQFIDRLGDTYRWKGHNISTTEVEKILNKYPQISLSSAYGVIYQEQTVRQEWLLLFL